MNIALDYDNTYTRDKVFWNDFIKSAQSRGHRVLCVTLRTQHQSEEVINDLKPLLGDNIFFTSLKSKNPYMFARGISIDVWIDDMPHFINGDY